MKEIYLNDKDAITILSKEDSKCWFFKFENNILCIEYNNKNLIVSIMNKEKVREKIKNLAENFWEIIKNEEEW
ncbi:MAG: hypothetical protein QW755_04880 [Nitrososphaerota archaeon]